MEDQFGHDYAAWNATGLVLATILVITITCAIGSCQNEEVLNNVPEWGEKMINREIMKGQKK